MGGCPALPYILTLLHSLLHFEGEEADTAAQVVDIDMVGNMGSTPAASTKSLDL